MRYTVSLLHRSLPSGYCRLGWNGVGQRGFRMLWRRRAVATAGSFGGGRILVEWGERGLHTAPEPQE